MKMYVKKQIGQTPYTFEVTGNNLGELLQESKKLSFGDVERCGVCGGQNLTLDFHIAKNKFKYSHVTCLSCRASLNFGQQMEKPDVFYLKKEWKPFLQQEEDFPE